MGRLQRNFKADPNYCRSDVLRGNKQAEWIYFFAQDYIERQSMQESVEVIITPEEEEFARKLEELSTFTELLANNELELETLRNSVFAFERQYLRLVGLRYVKLDEVRAEIADELAKANPNDSAAQQQFESARTTAHKSASEFESHGLSESQGKVNFIPSPELKKLYRQLATKIHPDTTTEETKKRHQNDLMSEINEAYAACDLTRLREILRGWESSPDSIVGEDVAAKLIRAIRSIAQISARLKAIEKEAEAIRQSEMFKMMEQVRLAEKSGRDLLQELVDKLDAEIEIELARLESMKQGFSDGK
ncbi:MAG: J domain-containing protein [Syntrophobacteraceae bacterium]